jgi:uncharacterized protein with gpF-like domain
MPLTVVERKRALKLGIAMIQKEKAYAAKQTAQKKKEAALKKAAKKIKVEFIGKLYKVTLEGKEYLVDRHCNGNVPKKSMEVAWTAICEYRKKNFSSAVSAWLSDKKNTKGINKWAVEYAKDMCKGPIAEEDFFDAFSNNILDIHAFNPQMWREAKGLDSIRHAIAEDLGTEHLL